MEEKERTEPIMESIVNFHVRVLKASFLNLMWVKSGNSKSILFRWYVLMLFTHKEIRKKETCNGSNFHLKKMYKQAL